MWDHNIIYSMRYICGRRITLVMYFYVVLTLLWFPQQLVIMTMVSILLVTLVSADYGRGGSKHRQNVMILPAGYSKAHRWVGVGKHGPRYIPKPFIAPRWIPHFDSTYTASWVPHAPKSRINNRAPSYWSFARSGGGGGFKSSIPQGFGPPKGNTVVGTSSDGYGGGHHQANHHAHGNHHHHNDGYSRSDSHQSSDPVVSVNNQRAPERPIINRAQEVLNSYSDPSFNSLARVPISTPLPRASHSGRGRLQSTLHVGSPYPGAASPTTLGINYNSPKSDDVINMPSFQSNLIHKIAYGNIPISSNSIAGEGFVSSSYAHV